MKNNTASLKTINDLHKNKQNIDKLWESEESLRVLTNSNPESVFIIDVEGNFIAANEKASQRFGKPLDELIGTNVFTYLSPELAMKRKEKVDDVVNTQLPVRFEDSRNNRYYDNYLHPIFDSNRKVIRIAVWVIDFTERKQAIDALKASEEKFRELAENIQDIFSIRTGNEILYVSPAYEIICGKSCQTLYEYPNSLLNAVHPDDFENVLKNFSSEYYIKTGLFDEEFRIIRPDGQIKWIWARTFPINSKRGVVYKLLALQKIFLCEKNMKRKLAKLLLRKRN